MSIQANGKCLCGAVSISSQNMSIHVGACHCSMCRKWTGGPFLAVDCKSAVDLSGSEFITSYKSSDWGRKSLLLTVRYSPVL